MSSILLPNTGALSISGVKQSGASRPAVPDRLTWLICQSISTAVALPETCLTSDAGGETGPLGVEQTRALQVSGLSLLGCPMEKLISVATVRVRIKLTGMGGDVALVAW